MQNLDSLSMPSSVNKAMILNESGDDFDRATEEAFIEPHTFNGDQKEEIQEDRPETTKSSQKSTKEIMQEIISQSSQHSKSSNKRM